MGNNWLRSYTKEKEFGWELTNMLLLQKKVHLIPDWINIWNTQKVTKISLLYLSGETSAAELPSIGHPSRKQNNWEESRR